MSVAAPTGCSEFECSFDVNHHGQLERRSVRLPDLSKNPYKPNTALRVAALALFIITIVVAALALQGHLLTFPQHFVHWMHHINGAKAFLGIGIALVLSGGALFVIQRISKKEDRFTQIPLGEIPRSDQWKRAMIVRLNEKGEITYFQEDCFSIDTSSLRGGGRKAHGYLPYHPGQEIVGGTISLATPLYMLVVMVYNVARAMIIPFYILARMAMGNRSTQYTLSDIPKEIGLSISRVAKAPFYATAYIFAAIGTVIDPQGGSRLVGAIERDWNEDVSLSDGMWACDLKWSRIFREKRENFGIYLARCKQPTCIIECDRFEEGAEVTVHSRTHALDPNRGFTFKGRVINGCLVAIERENPFNPGVTLDFV